MLLFKFRDILRATLPVRSGNEGWIGVNPRGDDYHVVVPVDVQISRGVMACNRPTDGTPFGGYVGWRYFRCSPYECEGQGENRFRQEQARKNAYDLIDYLTRHAIAAELSLETCDQGLNLDSSIDPESSPFPSSLMKEPWSRARCEKFLLATRGDVSITAPIPIEGERPCSKLQRTSEKIHCSGCAKSWAGISEFLREPAVRLKGYRACTEDFRMGIYVFDHVCGASVEIPVARFVRPRFMGKSLIGSHACPGLCYYEHSLAECSAVCEGSCYRKIAGKLISRKKG